VTARELTWSEFASLDGRNLRTPRFVRRSGLPLEVVAAVANAIGTRARELLEPELRVDVFLPVALDAFQWEALCLDALVYAARGESRWGAIVVGADDARRIVRHAFGERAISCEPLSELESRVIDRFVVALASALEPFFGRAEIARSDRIVPCASFVEVRFGAPLDAVIGLGVARDPERPVGPRLAPVALEGCPLECSARLGTVKIAALDLMALGIGDVLRLSSQGPSSATLNVGSNPIASGEGGVVGDLLAFMVCDVQSGTVECPR